MYIMRMRLYLLSILSTIATICLDLFTIGLLAVPVTVLKLERRYEVNTESHIHTVHTYMHTWRKKGRESTKNRKLKRS